VRSKFASCSTTTMQMATPATDPLPNRSRDEKRTTATASANSSGSTLGVAASEDRHSGVSSRERWRRRIASASAHVGQIARVMVVPPSNQMHTPADRDAQVAPRMNVGACQDIPRKDDRHQHSVHRLYGVDVEPQKYPSRVECLPEATR